MSRHYVHNKCLLILDVPARSVLPVTEANLKRGWRNDPAPKYLQQIGDYFYRQNRYLLLKVPSALNPGEYNYIINPRHKDFGKIKMVSIESISIDRRLVRIPGKKQRKKP